MNLSYEPLEKQLENLLKTNSWTDRDKLMILCLQEALQAGKTGNYPVGAVLTNSKLEMISTGHNQSFKPKPHSSAHAEMNALDEAEKQERLISPSSSILFVTLEPCVLCTTRILLAGVGTVIYLCGDPTDGGLNILPHLKGSFKSLATRVSFLSFEGSSKLKELGQTFYEWGEKLWQSEYQIP